MPIKDIIATIGTKGLKKNVSQSVRIIKAYLNGI